MSFRKHLSLVLGMTCMWAIAAGTHEKSNPRNMLRTNKLDTLKLSERFSVKTNSLGWLMLSPNLGLEFTLGNHNWSRWTVGVNGRLMGKTNDYQVPYMVHYLSEGRVEVRRYIHGKGLMRSWFTGGYGGFTNFSLKLSKTGYQGNGIIAGLTAGTIAPLYGYANGSSLDLELSVNAGILFAKTDEFMRNDAGTSYIRTRPNDGYQLVWNPLSCLVNCDALRISFVYRFGPSVADRYRRRINIDSQYRVLQDELALRRDSTDQARKLQRQQRRDSLETADYERRFEKQRLELERKHLRDSLERVKLKTSK